MNEAGLAVNLLWLAESQYPDETAAGPAVSLALWGQYVLDNFAMVAEAVQALRATPLRVATAQVPGEVRMATLHLAMSDARGTADYQATGRNANGSARWNAELASPA